MEILQGFAPHAFTGRAVTVHAIRVTFSALITVEEGAFGTCADAIPLEEIITG